MSPDSSSSRSRVVRLHECASDVFGATCSKSYKLTAAESKTTDDAARRKMEGRIRSKWLLHHVLTWLKVDRSEKDGAGGYERGQGTDK